MKNSFYKLSIVLIIIMLLIGCTETADIVDINIEEPTEEVTTSSDGIDNSTESFELIKLVLPQEMITAQMEFNLNLLKEVNEPDINLFYSSMSINTALTGVYFGAGTDTAGEINSVLGYGGMSDDMVRESHISIIKAYEYTGDTTFNTANSLWINEGFSVKQTYIDNMVEMLQMRVEELDLASVMAMEKINKWISDATEGLIPEFIKKDNNPLLEAELALINAIYFEGEWTKPFTVEYTRDAEFAGSKKISQIQMMKAFVDVRFAMVLVLPEGDINQFIKEQTASSLDGILNTFELQSDGIIGVAKFSMEETIDLTPPIKELGMLLAFSSSADFTPMTDAGISISDARHTAKIIVDEKGTVAAAVTEFAAAESEHFTFMTDRPFLFFIVDTKANLVLFTGKIENME